MCNGSSREFPQIRRLFAVNLAFGGLLAPQVAVKVWTLLPRRNGRMLVG